MAQTETIVKRVKLWNKGKTDYKQIVRGDEVFIPADSFLELPRRRAIEIRGHCTGKGVEARLEIEPILEKGKVTEVFIDHKTGIQYPTREKLFAALGIDPADANKAKTTTCYPCPVCDQVFDDKDAILAHMPKCMAKLTPAAATGAKSK